MPGGVPADAPSGFLEMCRRDFALCDNGAAGGTPGLGRTVLTLALVQDVNRAVNRRVLQRSDVQTYRVAELWTRPRRGRRATGDCEDLALEKRAMLLALGVEPAKLVLAVTYSQRTGLHTLLVARLDAGDYVLDSASPVVMLWNSTQYSWVRQQSRVDPRSWLTVEQSGRSLVQVTREATGSL